MARRKTTSVKSGKLRSQRLSVTSSRIVYLQFLEGFNRVMKVVVVVGGIILLGMAGREVMKRFFLEKDEFSLVDVEVKSNGGMMSRERVLKVMGLSEGQSVFDVKLSEMRTRLQALPEVRSAKVMRYLPGRLEVTLVERIPMGWLECGRVNLKGRDFVRGLLVDVEGVVFPPIGLGEEAGLMDLPVVRVDKLEEGIVVGKAVGNLDLQRSLHLSEVGKAFLKDEDWKIDSIELLTPYSLKARMTTGLEAVFGMYDHERQFGDLMVLVKNGRKMSWVNLIPEKNIPVRFGKVVKAGSLEGM